MTSDYPALNSERCSIYDPQGRLIWVSPAWGCKCETCFGFGYLEFIHYDDTEVFVQWVKAPNADTVTFRSMLPGGGTRMTAKYAKIPFNGNWLVVGEHVPGWDCYDTIMAIGHTLALYLWTGTGTGTGFGGGLVALG